MVAGQGTGSVGCKAQGHKMYMAVGGALCAEWGETRGAVCSAHRMGALYLPAAKGE